MRRVVGDDAREIQTAIPPDIALGARVTPDLQKTPADVYRPLSPKLELVNSDLLAAATRRAPPAAPADPAFVALGAASPQTWSRPRT